LGEPNYQVSLLDAAGGLLGEREVIHGGAGLAELCDWLVATSGAQPAAVAVAIEVSHGPVVETLLERGFLVHAINPKQLDRFRDRFTVAGAKDDRRDALVLADSLRTDPHCFRPLTIDDPLVIELRACSRLAEELQQERTRLANRLRDQLWRYYPQALELTDDPAADWFLAFWKLAPTPDKARRLRDSSLARFLRSHGVRRLTAAAALHILRQPPLVVAPGTTAAASAHIRSLVARLRLVNRQLRETHAGLDALCAKLVHAEEPSPGQPTEPRDATILRSLPGIGRIVLATLLAEAPEPLKQRDYHALRALSGVAPVTRRSGKSCRVVDDRHAIIACVTPSITGPASPSNTTRQAASAMPPSATAVIPMAAPCAGSPIASSPSPAPCSKTAPSSIQHVMPTPPPEQHAGLPTRRPP
jgi:transposase